MIKSLDRVSPSEYLLPIVSAWVEMAYTGTAQADVLSLAPEDRLLVEVHNGALRSALVWCYYEDDRSARVLFGYTWPNHRNLGLYTSLYNQMKTEARALGAIKTVGGVIATNGRMLELAQHQGRKVVAVWVEEKLF